MLNSTITIKMKQRINKLDSNDYDNIECWQIVESFNKAQVEWTRRQLHGINQVREGDEQSTRRKDDLQVLLNTYSLPLSIPTWLCSNCKVENYSKNENKVKVRKVKALDKKRFSRSNLVKEADRVASLYIRERDK